MALTKTNVTVKSGHAIQANFVTQLTLALDASYPAGGYALDLADDIPGHSILFVHVEPAYPYTFVWDRANSKLVVYKEDGTSGVTAEASGDLAAVTGLVATVLSE